MNKTILAVVTTVVLGFLARPALAQDPVFDLPALLGTPLNPKTTKTTEKDGIVTEEVMFHSETDGDKSVDIFALFSYPKGGTHLPAYVWNQGGLYPASSYWTEYGARRGYAVLCIDFPMPGYRSTGGYPITATLELGDDPHQAPIYHGAVALLKAVYYLQGKPLLNAVTPVTVKKDGKKVVARWEFSGSRPVQLAEMYLSYGDAGNWRSRYWATLPATISGQRCESTLPASPLPYYIIGSITDTNGYRSATPMVRIDPAAYGLLN